MSKREWKLFLKDAAEHLATAREMINKMGYHRRDKDVEEIKEQLAVGS